MRALLATTVGHGLIGNWSPGIGDPNVVGWLTVVAYLSAAFLCACVRRKLRTGLGGGASSGERQLWLVIAVLFVFLGINKQLDLQTALTEIGRMVARRGGWYERRRTVQRYFVMAVGLGSLAAALGLLWLVRRSGFWARVAVVGTVLVFGFVVIRAASFHHVDHWIGSTWHGLYWNWILELGGISIVIAAGAARLRGLARATSPA